MNQENSLFLTILHPEQGTKKTTQPEKPSFLSLKEKKSLLMFHAQVFFIAHFAEVRHLVLKTSLSFLLFLFKLFATKTRMLAAVVAALICFLAYNFFLYCPVIPFQISAIPGSSHRCCFLQQF